METALIRHCGTFWRAFQSDRITRQELGKEVLQSFIQSDVSEWLDGAKELPLLALRAAVDEANRTWPIVNYRPSARMFFIGTPSLEELSMKAIELEPRYRDLHTLLERELENRPEETEGH